MDFTREPIIETIITPKEGCKLVIRSSKNTGQEEYFVDAVEIITFGSAQFFRSLERPKAFLVPVSDFEVLEVREARMVLKNVGLDRSIKIGGGREGGGSKGNREVEKPSPVLPEEEEVVEQEERTVQNGDAAAGEARVDGRLDKKRDRRRNYRKRRGRDENKEETAEISVPPLEDGKIDIAPPQENSDLVQEEITPLSPSMLSTLLQPPPTLISETINRYRQNELFKGAFYLTEEDHYKPHDKVQDLLNEDEEEEEIPLLQDPTFISEPELNSGDESGLKTDEDVKVSVENEDLAPEAPYRISPPPIPLDLIRGIEQEAALPLYAEEERVEKGDAEEDRIEKVTEEEEKREEVKENEEEKIEKEDEEELKKDVHLEHSEGHNL